VNLEPPAEPVEPANPSWWMPPTAPAPSWPEPPRRHTRRRGTLALVTAAVVALLLLGGALLARSRAGDTLHDARAQGVASNRAHDEAASTERSQATTLRLAKQAEAEQTRKLAKKRQLANALLVRAGALVRSETALATLSRDGAHAWERGDIGAYNDNAHRFNEMKDTVNRERQELEDAIKAYEDAPI
jgi:hypothetical protein